MTFIHEKQTEVYKFWNNGKGPWYILFLIVPVGVTVIALLYSYMFPNFLRIPNRYSVTYWLIIIGIVWISTAPIWLSLAITAAVRRTLDFNKHITYKTFFGHVYGCRSIVGFTQAVRTVVTNAGTSSITSNNVPSIQIKSENTVIRYDLISEDYQSIKIVDGIGNSLDIREIRPLFAKYFTVIEGRTQYIG